MAQVAEKNNIEEIIKSISERNNEPPCVSEHRLSMWNEFSKMPMPLRANHLWRYSDPELFEINSRKVSSTSAKVEFETKADLEKLGVLLIDLKEAFKQENLREKVKNAFSSQIKKYNSKYAMLNAATWNSGYFLYVPENVSVDEPVIVKIKAQGENEIQSIRVLALLEKNANVTLIDEILSAPESKDLYMNIVMETYLADGAKLKYLNDQANNKETIQHLFQRVELGENAELTNLIVSLGGKLTKADLGSILKSKNAKANTYGIVLGEGNQRFDHHTVLEHVAPESSSGLDFRVVLKDKAKSAYTGNLKIENQAINCSAWQENRNLLLSDKAQADSIPELEILTNDVEHCAHGVTVGQVDKDQIFYLMSRGIEQKDAERLVIEGFLEPTVSKIPDDSLQQEVKDRVAKKLETI